MAPNERELPNLLTQSNLSEGAISDGDTQLSHTKMKIPVSLERVKKSKTDFGIYPDNKKQHHVGSWRCLKIKFEELLTYYKLTEMFNTPSER